MKCFYHYFTNKKKVIQNIIISDNPLIILDIDYNCDLMGVEYCE